MRKLAICLILVAVFVSFVSTAMAQRIIESTEGFVNEIILADTLGDGSRANTVYVFRRGETYYQNAQIYNVGWAMTLKAEDGTGALPKMVQWPNADGNLNRSVDAQDNAYLYNIYFDGMGPDLATGDPDPLYQMSGQLLRAAAAGKELIVDGCILNNCGQVMIRSNSGARKVQVTNTVFANMGQVVRDNIGNGRGFDIRNGVTDTLIVKNCTFVNGHDRVLRHLDSSGDVAGILGYCEFDHCTIVNWMGTFGMFMLGDLGSGFKFTNNLLVNPQALGYEPGHPWRNDEFGVSGEVDENGKNIMYMFTDEPNATLDPSFEIHHNVICYEAAALQYFSDYSVQKAPIMSKRITGKLAPSMGTPFVEATVTLTNTPPLMTELMQWYQANPGAVTTAEVEMHRMARDYWAESLDCSYQTSDNTFMGTDGKPVGDKNWSSKITTVKHYEGKSFNFELANNYPNPFNPSTTIRYSINRQDKVTLKIFDTLGREIAVLVNKVQNAGNYSINFDAANLASGVYVYSLQMGENTLVKKMLFILNYS